MEMILGAEDAGRRQKHLAPPDLNFVECKRAHSEPLTSSSHKSYQKFKIQSCTCWYQSYQKLKGRKDRGEKNRKARRGGEEQMSYLDERDKEHDLELSLSLSLSFYLLIFFH